MPFPMHARANLLCKGVIRRMDQVGIGANRLTQVQQRRIATDSVQLPLDLDPGFIKTRIVQKLLPPMMNRFEDRSFDLVCAIPYSKRSVRVPATHPVAKWVANRLVPDGLLEWPMNYRDVRFEGRRLAFHLQVLRGLTLSRIITQVVEKILRDPQRNNVAEQIIVNIRDNQAGEELVQISARGRGPDRLAPSVVQQNHIH